MVGAAPERGAAHPVRLPSLTGLRWIGAMLVFGFHVGTLGIIADPGHREVVAWLFTLGLSGVQFFFVLSGFVLVWSARPQDRAVTFWRRRFAKVYPNHLVLWAAVILLGLYWADPLDLRVATVNLLLVQAWVPTSGWFYSVNTVSWSLSCEIFFYLCLPLVLPLLRRMRPWMLYAVIVAMPLLILAMWPAQQLVPEADRWWFTQVFPLVRSLEFWMGVAAAELMRRGCWRGPGVPGSSLIFLVAWVAAIELIPGQFWTALLAAVYVLVITAAAQADVRGTWSPWRSRPLVWLGEVSFAFYLVHVFLVLTVRRFTGTAAGFPGWWGPLAAVGYLLGGLLLAWLLFRFVETPAMRWLGPPRRRPPDDARGGSAPDPAGPPPVTSSVAPQPRRPATARTTPARAAADQKTAVTDRETIGKPLPVDR